MEQEERVATIATIISAVVVVIAPVVVVVVPPIVATIVVATPLGVGIVSVVVVVVVVVLCLALGNQAKCSNSGRQNLSRLHLVLKVNSIAFWESNNLNGSRSTGSKTRSRVERKTSRSTRS